MLNIKCAINQQIFISLTSLLSNLNDFQIFVTFVQHWNRIEPIFKTHHYIILFVRPRHSKPGMESYCSSSTEQLS